MNLLVSCSKGDNAAKMDKAYVKKDLD